MVWLRAARTNPVAALRVGDVTEVTARPLLKRRITSWRRSALMVTRMPNNSVSAVSDIRPSRITRRMRTTDNGPSPVKYVQSGLRQMPFPDGGSGEGIPDRPEIAGFFQPAPRD